MSAPSNRNAVVGEETIAGAASVDIFDGSGNKIKFGSLFELQKTVVVFIRHFFCGRCQQYVAELTKIPQEVLETAGVNIAVIGCGDWSLIPNYRDITFQTPNSYISIYAEPTRTLYRAMGMTTESLSRPPSGETKKSYVSGGNFMNALTSTMRALKHPSHVGKQGNISQLGGEFILGPKYECSFAHYMQHTEDHTEVSELLRNAGVSLT